MTRSSAIRILSTVACVLSVAALPAAAPAAYQAPAAAPPQSPPAPKKAPAARAERGRYLVSIMACGDCHTPMKVGTDGPEPDMKRLLSGHPEKLTTSAPPKARGSWTWAGIDTNTAFAGAWGVSYAANLTPDKNTGLGIWTEEMFIAAMRTGKHMGTARPIAPPMPWPGIRTATDDDLKAIFAYLRTIAPIANHVPDYQPPARVTP